MSLRTMLALAVLVAVGWWFSPMSPRVPAPPAHADGISNACPFPPRVQTGAVPLQSPVPHDLKPFALKAGTLTPRAGISIEARLLLRRDYRVGREASLSPTDLALGWGRMREDSVLDRLELGQGGRFYHYRWQGEPPLPPDEIMRSSANMHMIPANAGVARALSKLRAGDDVRIDGWLVDVDAPDGSQWRTSLTREDSGGGACELIYVCAIGPG
ncbi:hypothetical protein LU699_04065 [Luteimonas fraxinea]|uniref:Uncharacterized protein n=1 Tax=Luteimonas fraxinea TaxID=2901869 RepID=A0ABS8UAJ8_9GAMM|nr:hypothetical protein [Luteimonas fraxinea]MCD9095912.1 hypothetical protein [Luteimonas fraxinea]MCD9124501.1 hypothetical protein [Luteimonas fraxinea]UHH10913.1 hypothetical protein LU699_04065 [Luteimonas fraxinea]